MLATANRLALSPDELGIVELGEIEDDARCARAMISVPPAEHSGLLAARTALTEANRLVNTRQIEFDGACAVVGVLQQRGPWWRRAIGVFTGGNYRRAREIRAAIAQQSKALAVLVAVKRQRSDADSGLTREVQSHREAVRQHMEHWTKVAQIAERKASAAPRVYELLKLLPGSIHFGAAGLCEIAAKLMPLQREQHTEAHDYTTAPLAAQP